MYTDKYKAIAWHSPVGNALEKLVKEHWQEWITIVENSGIYKKYKRMNFSGVPDSCAYSIYIDALWGYGAQGWEIGSKDPVNYVLNKYQNQLKIPRDTAIKFNLIGPENTPIEFWYLDQWLESLCKKASR